MLWSDESTFRVTDGIGGNIYRRHGSDPLDPRYIEATVKHPDSEMVWGAFSGKGRAELQVLPKNLTVNQHVYLELLSDHLPQAFEDTDAAIFQQDSAPAHRAISVTQWLDDCCVTFIKDWPGNSPDINPIENLWEIVKQDLQGKDVSSVPKLVEEIRASWANISQETLLNLAQLVP